MFFVTGLFCDPKFMMAEETQSQYVIQNTTEVALLDCKEAFEGLSAKERLYAHHLAQASFKGGLIVLFQVCLLFYMSICYHINKYSKLPFSMLGG